MIQIEINGESAGTFFAGNWMSEMTFWHASSGSFMIDTTGALQLSVGPLFPYCELLLWETLGVANNHLLTGSRSTQRVWYIRYGQI